MPVLSLQVHGAAIEAFADQALLDGVQHLFEPFVAPRSPDATALHIEGGACPDVWSTGNLLCEVPSPVGVCRLYRAEAHRRAEFEGIGTFVVPSEGPARLWLNRADHPQQEAAVSFSISELLKLNGVYSMHAGAVAHRGRGILMPGVSGTGKSTATAALVLAGFDYLSDDLPFLTVRDQGPHLMAFPAPLKLSQESQQRLATQAATGAPAANGKEAVPAVDGLGATTVESARAELLIFLRIRDVEGCVARPVLQTDALTRLLPHALCTFDADLSRTQFQALAELVRVTRAFEVDVGPDPRTLAPLVMELLDGSASES